MSALLPERDIEARAFNAATMELGATVCVARSPRCEECPIAAHCAWRAAGYPAYEGARKAVQARFEGSDRQVRGLVMRELRAAHRPVAPSELAAVWADGEQLDRAVAGLVSDGLAVSAEEGLRLPEA
jgi:A/G-specific adenine glycosylase